MSDGKQIGRSTTQTDQKLSLMDFLEYGAAMSEELARLADAFEQVTAARHLRAAALMLSDRALIEAAGAEADRQVAE